MTRLFRDVQNDAFGAVGKNNVDHLKKLLDEGARPDLNRYGSKTVREDKKGNLTHTLLERAVIQAISKGYDDEILLFIEKKGYDITKVMRGYATPQSMFESGAKNGSFLKLIINRWSDIFEQNFGRWQDVFTVHKLVSLGDLGSLKVILNTDVMADSRDQSGRTGLMMADQDEIVKILLKAGADPYATDQQGKTPIWHAAKRLIRNVNEDRHGNLIVSVNHIGGLIELCGNGRLLNDPHAKIIGRLLGEYFERGLIAGNGSSVYPRAFDPIKPQVQEAWAMDRRERLSKKLNISTVETTANKTPKKSSPTM